MEIKNIPNTLPPVALTGAKNLASVLPQLQPGTALNAVVTAKLAENSFLLTLANGQTLRAQSPTVLELGQTLKLEVAKVGAVPELKIINEQPNMQPDKAVVLQSLREFLPKQQNLTDLAISLRQLVTTSTTSKPDAINKAISEVLAAMPSKDNLVSAEGVKQSISNSGVFLEAKVAEQLPPQGDLKAQLLVLADTLQKTQVDQQGKENVINTAPIPSTPEPKQELARTSPERLAEVTILVHDKDNALLSKTEGAIARIVVDQLAVIPQSDEQQHAWQIQIPYTHGQHTDTVKLTISRDHKANKANEKQNWSVDLELNPPGLGKLQTRISLIDDHIDTYFWSDQKNITALVLDNLNKLADSYTQAGLSVGNLTALQGAAHTKTPDSPAMPGLLDEMI